jgi:general secretion pathway protein E/type IV pilus assembly protein PilB
LKMTYTSGDEDLNFVDTTVDDDDNGRDMDEDVQQYNKQETGRLHSDDALPEEGDDLQSRDLKKDHPAEAVPQHPEKDMQSGDHGDDEVIESALEDEGAVQSQQPSESAVSAEAREAVDAPDADRASSSDLQAPTQSPQQSDSQSGGGELVSYDDGEGGEPANKPGDGSGRIGDRLVSEGFITPDQLNVALQEKKISGRLLGQTLVDLGFINEKTLTNFLAESSGAEVFDPRNTIMDSEALELLERKQAEKLQVLPVSYTEGELVVAMADPYDVVAQDTLRGIIPKDVKLRTLITTPSVIGEAIDAAYGYASNIQDILKELEHEVGDVDLSSLEQSESYSHPIVRLVNALLFEAVKIGASDLHFEPEENFVRLRYRVDGVLFTAQILHKNHWSGISQRLKVMSNLNIADKLSPQDGRFNLNVGGREADFRVSSLPTVYGENIVLRVLDKSASIMPLEDLGFSPPNLEKIKRAQARPEGIIIVTGPTGSGKSTTLYSMLNEINDVEVNVQTLEDPVEYSLPMIRQTHVREGVLEFGDGIRAMLRQDPDIVFIGEIRDKETAEMALKAAMTGHQVYTTLHTNDSFSAIPRLVDLGLKQSMISGNVISVFAQRLARRLCEKCKYGYEPDGETCEMLGVDRENPPTIYQARKEACSACGGQGYKGRIALAEILTLDEEMDEIIADGGSKADLMHKARERGFQNMAADGITKILEGITSIEAVAKVVDLQKS